LYDARSEVIVPANWSVGKRLHTSLSTLFARRLSRVHGCRRAVNRPTSRRVCRCTPADR